MWLQHESKRQLRLEKADSKRNVTLIVSWQNPIDWLRHAGAKPREEVDYSAARQDTSSDRDCRFDQKEESSMIGRDLFNSPCRICRRPTVHRTRTTYTQRESPKVRGIAGHIEQTERGFGRKSPQAHKHFCPLLPTAMVFVSYGFVLVQVQVQEQIYLTKWRQKRRFRSMALAPTREAGVNPGPLWV